MVDARLDAIVSLLDEIDARIHEHVGQATVLVDEAESIGNLMKTNLVQMERVRRLLSQTAQLRAAIARQRDILEELRRQMRALRPHSS
jgi:hypothetical protein